jgi:hypothetical protein
MNTLDFLAHILRHAWFWPIEFWMRPLTVIDRYKEAEWAEFVASLIGSGFWGTIVGTVLWLMNGDIHSIWITAVAGTIAGVIAISIAGAFAVVFALAIVGVFAVTLAVVFAFSEAGADVGAVVVTGIMVLAAVMVVGEEAKAGILVGALLGTYLLIGAGLGSWLPLKMVAYFTLIIGLIQMIAIIIFKNTKKNDSLYEKWSRITLAITSVIGLPIAGFAFFPLTPIEQTSVWGIVLTFSLSIGFIAGFFNDSSDGLWTAKQNQKLQLKKASQASLLLNAFSFYSLLILYLWFFTTLWVSDELGQKFQQLTIFFTLAPIISTCLFLYPFVALIAVWQYRHHKILNFTTQNFYLTAPFRWQSFAYPLPKLRTYLFKLAIEHDAKTAFNAIEQVQLWTLQMTASRKAAQDLSNHSETAINFCGEIAIQTNNATLLPVSVTGNIGRSIAGLVKPQEKEKEQPLRLWITDFPPKTIKVRFRVGKQLFFAPKPMDDWLKTFYTIRQATISERLDYALAQLQNCQNYKNVKEYQHLLTQLSSYAKASQLKEILSIAEQSLVIRNQYPDWMQGGWTILKDFTKQLTEFKKYHLLESIEARREYLTRQQQKLKALTWKDLPNYWTNIGQELVEHWIAQLEQAKAQAKNFLQLEIDLPQTSLLLGRQSLTLRVQNPTPVIAESLHIQVEDTANIFWSHQETRYPILEGRREADLHLECQIDTPGRYVIRGQLTAQDLYGHVFKKPFNFQIVVAEKADIYRIPDYQPYVVGEGLSNDRTFVGRTDLLAWLGSLWRQPDGKPAVVLIGQRRIGKTSLLNKIQRDGLKRTQLLPVYLDTQGIGDNKAKSFLTIMSHRMAEAVGTSKPTFNDTTPYLDFQTFLESTKTLLDQRRFLVMIDEAEPIFQGKFGSELPDFLRSLMQQAHYPTVLLFCGTYFLKRVAWDYSSVFFNTAQFKTVSYLSAPESAELLQKPSKDILEFDEYVLEQAHVLTHGQPLLLQTLGANMIEDCNATIRSGEERSNYINFKDLETATQMLVQQQNNAAFLEHWIGSDTKTHRVLSVLAWATDEINRPQLDMDGLLAALKEHHLDLPRKPVFDIVQRLVDEEILESTGPAYRFQVPLYRQWIAWRWEPSKVREEGLED